MRNTGCTPLIPIWQAFHFGAFGILRLEMFKWQVCINIPKSFFLKSEKTNKQTKPLTNHNNKPLKSQTPVPGILVKRPFTRFLPSLPPCRRESLKYVVKWQSQANILEECQMYLVPKRTVRPTSSECRPQRSRYKEMTRSFKLKMIPAFFFLNFQWLKGNVSPFQLMRSTVTW